MRWGFIDGAPLVAVVESANPSDLEARVAALLASITALAGDHRIVAVELSGAGYGDAFTVRVEYGLDADLLDFSPSGPPSVDRGTPGGLLSPAPDDITPVVYMADNTTELAAARTRYYTDNAFPADSTLLGSALAGATQGRRVCVLELIGPTRLYSAPDAPPPI